MPSIRTLRAQTFELPLASLTCPQIMFLFSWRKLIRAASLFMQAHAEQIRFSTRFGKSTLFIKPHCTPERICGIEGDAFALLLAKLCFRSLQERWRHPRSLPLRANSHTT